MILFYNVLDLRAKQAHACPGNTQLSWGSEREEEKNKAVNATT